jgi:hypothetical protein
MKQPDEELRKALLNYSRELQTEPHSVASVVWLRAERRNRRLALERATRPLLIMQAIGVLCSMLVCAWVFSMHPAGNTSLFFWGSFAIFLVIAGCWTMLHAARRLTF